MLMIALMAVRFCVLGSGSSGNAALILTPRAQVLIDIGFPPDELAERMAGTGASWDSLSAVVLTHTHGDHLKKRCLRELADRRAVFYCHESHEKELAHGRYARRLAATGRLRTYDGRRAFEPAVGVRFVPLPLPHDCPPTFGFRIEAANGSGRALVIGYLADLGHATQALAKEVRDADLLALEFNHDEDLERGSGRPWSLIERVLGDEGHLSNRQAAELLDWVVRLGANGGPKRLVQMHLSEECNRPELAFQAAKEVVERLGAHTEIFSTRQDRRGTVHEVNV